MVSTKDLPGGRLDLGPQPPHVHVHGSGAAQIVVPPDLAQQGLASVDAPGVGCQQHQELEFFVGERDPAPGHRHVVAFRVDAQLPHGQHLRPGRTIDPKHRLFHPHGQFVAGDGPNDQFVRIQGRVVLRHTVTGNRRQDRQTPVFTPNPPKDTAGRREDSGGGVRELQGR